MQQPALLNVARPVERVVVGREVKVDGLSDVDAAAAVTAQVRKQEPRFASGIDREAHPWQIKHGYPGNPELRTPGLTFAAIRVDLDLVGVKHPGGVIRRTEGHRALSDLDITVGLSRQRLGRPG